MPVAEQDASVREAFTAFMESETGVVMGFFNVSANLAEVEPAQSVAAG